MPIFIAFVYKNWKRAVQMFFVCRRDYRFPFPKGGVLHFFLLNKEKVDRSPLPRESFFESSVGRQKAKTNPTAWSGFGAYWKRIFAMRSTVPAPRIMTVSPG